MAENKFPKYCDVCKRSTKRGKLVRCKNSQKLVCKDCCIMSLKGTMGNCIHWGFCWPSYFI